MSHLQTTSVTLRHTWGTLSVTLCHTIRLLNYNTKINKTISHGLRLSQDHLRAALRRHSWQAALLRYLSGYVGWPRSAHSAAQATPFYKLGLCQALALT